MVRRGIVAIVGAALAACSEQAPSSSPPALSTPLAVDFDHLRLSWSPGTSGPVTGWIVEGREVPGPFAPLGPGVLPAGPFQHVVELDPATPELTDFEFRVRAVPERDGGTSAAVPFRRTLRPPGGLAAAVTADRAAIAVSWANASSAADGLVLERRTLRADGNAAPWRAIGVEYPAVAFLDEDLADYVDATAFEYRLAAVRGGVERSQWATMRTTPAPMEAPLLGHEPIPGGVRLTFQHRSRWTTRLEVERIPLNPLVEDGVVARLPASATSWDDLSGPPGIYEYWLVAEADTVFGTVACSSRTGRVATTPPESWGTEVTLVEAPFGARTLLRSPDGSFAAAGNLGGYTLEPPWFRPPGSPGPKLRTRDGTLAFLPGLVLDDEGHAHAAYVPGPPDSTAPVPIMHAWHDGEAWHEEEIARRRIFWPQGTVNVTDRAHAVRIALGGDGTPLVSWQCGVDPTAATLEVASRERTGSWRVENVSEALDPALQVRWMNHLLTGDGAGRPHLVVLDWDGALLHLTPGPAGWVWERVPTDVPASMVFWDEGFWSLLGGGDTLAVIHRPAWTEFPAVDEVRVQVRRRDGWGEAVVLEAPSNAAIAAAIARDGSRLAVAGSGASYGEAWAWIADDAGERRLRFYAGPRSSPLLGFRPDGKLWVAEHVDTIGEPGPDWMATTLLFEER